MWEEGKEGGKLRIAIADTAKGATDFCPFLCGSQGIPRRRHLLYVGCVCGEVGGSEGGCVRRESAAIHPELDP